MVRYSTLDDQRLEFKLQEKFDQLKIQIAEDQGINLTALSFQMGIDQAKIPTNMGKATGGSMMGGRTGSMMPG